MYYWYPVNGKSRKDGTLIEKQLFLEYVPLKTPPQELKIFFLFHPTDWSFYVGKSYSVFLFRNFSHVYCKVV